MRPQGLQTNRRGLTLLEVLVAIAVFSLGVTAVIALFPIGVTRMRQSVLDTRCTLLAQQAVNITKLQGIPDRLGAKFLDYSTIGSGSPPPINIYAYLNLDSLPASRRAQLMGWDSNAAGPATNPTPAPGTVKSFPVLIDPLLFHAQAAKNPSGAYEQLSIPIFYYYTSNFGLAAAATPYLDIPIVTTQKAWEIFSTLGSGPADSYIYRWFADSGGVQFESKNPVIPSNPSRSTAVPKDFLITNNLQTAQRDYDYSWAIMLQQDLDVSDTLQPGVLAGWNPTDVKYLCFYKRNISAPVRVIEGCFFNNSRKVTLSWPNNANNPTPKLKRGTWICEASITGGKVSGTYGGAQNYYRQAFHFYRIAGLDPIQIVSNRAYQVVDIEGSPATDYEGRVSSVGDARSLPDAYPGTLTWPQTVATPGAPMPADTIMYYPVAIFDGLEWVY